MSAFVRPRHGNDLLRELSSRALSPTGVHLQVADRCNHACAHCYQHQGQKGELSLDALKAVLDDLARARVLTLNVSGGEATLRPDLLELLAYARARGFAVRLFTNAFLVDDTLADGIAALGLLDVHVSVYSAVASQHDQVTRVPGSHARTLHGVRTLRARGVRVTLKCPAIALGPGGAAGVEVLARALGCGFSASTELTAMEDGDLAPRALQVSAEALLGQGLLEPWVPGPDDGPRREKKLAGAPCGVGTSGLVVLPDGELIPCTDTVVPLGNLTRKGLRETLDTSETAGLFRELTWAHVHGCRDCDLLLGCSRCHATALHVGGDYLGPYEPACARARARYRAGLGAEVELLAPSEGCEPGRRGALGPYRITAPGRLLPVPDVVTETDRARAEKHRWLRKDAHNPGGAEAAPYPPGGEGGRTPRLVPLRRRPSPAVATQDPPGDPPDGGR
ncbi:MAG: radical SAM protein [Deltaproteobacteria bacterium]|nr:radical SAM protein [Deltaproteobacteria bacterium]